MWVFRTFKVVQWREDSEGVVTCNNLTIINFVLITLGPLREPILTTILLIIQVNLFMCWNNFDFSFIFFKYLQINYNSLVIRSFFQ